MAYSDVLTAVVSSCHHKLPLLEIEVLGLHTVRITVKIAWFGTRPEIFSNLDSSLSIGLGSSIGLRSLGTFGLLAFACSIMILQ